MSANHDMIQNDTFGDITPAELADLKSHARPCSRCGLTATVDPEFHTQRYGHPAQFRDARGTWEWSTEKHEWLLKSREGSGD